MIIPAQIPVSSDLASAFRVDGDLTARDLSWIVMLMHQAAVVGQAGEIALSDNATRHAMGLSRRDKISTEEARWRRLRGATINGFPAPTTVFDIDIDGSFRPRRHNLDDRLQITIDEQLLEAWTGETYDRVYIPLRLLQLAERRFSIVLMMRALAWSSGDHPRSWLERRDGRMTRMRIGIPDLMSMMPVPGSTWSRRLVDDVLIPAAAEISSLTDWQIDIIPRVAHTGRIRDVDIVIVAPDVDPADDDRVIEARGDRWRRAPRRSHRPDSSRPAMPTATPVSVSNTALDAVVPLSVKRPPLLEVVSNAMQSPGPSFEVVGHDESRNKVIDF